MDGLDLIILGAALLALIACPILGICLAMMGVRNRRLSERNAAQAVTIGQLQRRVSGADAEEERRARFEAECG